nr:aminoacyl-tRNA hydrolase [Blastococcus aurantiacus]
MTDSTTRGGAGTAGAPAASAPGEGPFLVVGLGNPGPGYAGNRHNVGAMVLDVLAERAGIRLSPGKGARSRAVSGEGRLAGRRVVLARPLTYMNESGGPVRGLLDYHKLPATDLVVVHDELDIDFAVVRLKRGGGEGGHNGLRSITRSTGTKDYLRVRVGIGRPPGRQDPADYVLKDFSSTERKELDLLLVEAADATELLLARGLEAAQNEVHPRT